MASNVRNTLNQFQCEHIRILEETFAQTFSEREDVRLFFINENVSFTDGRNIVIDPGFSGLYADRNALFRTGQFLKWPSNVLSSEWNALQIITRALNIHECLHILYTDFPCHSFHDPKCDTNNKRKVMSLISNIIEDAYIEAVGCSIYDNLEFYLKFMRVSQLFLSERPKEVFHSLKDMLKEHPDLVITNQPKERTDTDRLIDYLGIMGNFLLYPWTWSDKNVPSDIKNYVDTTKQYFIDGCIQSSPEGRYEYCQKIFDVIAHLIPDDKEKLDIDQIIKTLAGFKTHLQENGVFGSEPHKGRTQEVITRLFTDLHGNWKNSPVPVDQLAIALQEFAINQSAASNISNYTGSIVILTGANYDGAFVHKNIKTNENRPRININLRKAYQNIYSKYSSVIRSYNSRFAQLLRAHAIVREDKYKFGNGISSNRLGDPQKRYWYRTIDTTDIPDISVLLLVDGSGSMRGDRIQSAMNSALILHEVLGAQNIEHAIVEHRAHFDDPEIDINILLGFDARKDEKLNILKLDAYGDNRDGLALYWAERYIGKMTRNEYKLIIVLSDGLPAHGADDYYPPASVRDTANAVQKITKRGTNVVAIALDDEGSFDCYNQLSQIYPNLIGCNDLNRLTGQLLGIVGKLIKV